MTPLDSRNLQRLTATLADVERAIDVSRVHIASGCPDAAQRELAQAKLSIEHARRIAEGPARDAIPDAEFRQLLELDRGSLQVLSDEPGTALASDR